jgi:hypothetical protein
MVGVDPRQIGNATVVHLHATMPMLSRYGMRRSKLSNIDRDETSQKMNRAKEKETHVQHKVRRLSILNWYFKSQR